jgi:hypothetical protein
MALPMCDMGCGREAHASRQEFGGTVIDYLCPPCEIQVWAERVDVLRREGIIPYPDPAYEIAAPVEQEAEPAETPARRPQVVPDPAAADAGEAGAAATEPPAAGADDGGGDDRLESRPRARGTSRSRAPDAG